MSLKLPPEVLRNILDHAVCHDDEEVFTVLRWREVNRLFEREVTTAFVNHRLTSLNDLPSRCLDRMSPDFKRVLVQEILIGYDPRARNDFASYVYAVADDLASFSITTRDSRTLSLIRPEGLIDEVCQAIVYARKYCSCNRLVFDPEHSCRLNGQRSNLRNTVRKTSFLVAVIRNRVKVVRALLCAGFPPEVECPIFRNPLKWAAQLGHTDIIELLLEASVDRRNNIQRTEFALKLAAQAGQVEVLHLLLSPKYELNISQRAVDDAVTSAAAKGEFDAVKCILKLRPQVHPISANAICLSAAKRGRADIVEALLDGVEGLAQWNPLGVLEVAARRGHLKICQNLIKRGLVESVRERSNVLSMGVALGGSIPVLKLLWSQGMELSRPAEVFVISAERGHLAMLHLALINSFDQFHGEPNQLTYLALLAAIAQNHLEAVRILYPRTIFVRAQLQTSRSARRDRPMSSELFLDLDEDDCGDDTAIAPLVMAIDSGNVEMAKLLMSMGDFLPVEEFLAMNFCTEARKRRERQLRNFRARLRLDRRYGLKTYSAPQWKVDEALEVVKEYGQSATTEKYNAWKESVSEVGVKWPVSVAAEVVVAG
ncbi:ankyrin repeat-containing domain protein [Lophiotrema nucula]|uniref:Ankyrin repeat-containing domain protein n=1 Tax=Lophiotrema nucula TaxID=690887 RepID=A0A6A5ZS12_9PLEO|nr:ankyrin repeat-containing domain protein [Lophiotrema nucula]